MNSTRNMLEKEMKSLLAQLAVSARQYDNGNEAAALRLALDVRAIFHNHAKTMSLFNQLQLKNNVFLLSTTAQYIPGYSLNYTGLVREKNTESAEASPETKKTEEYLPLCNIDKEFTNKWHIFDDWWKELVVSSKIRTLSRQDIVLMIANQDEGAHIDGEPDDNYSGLQCNAEGWLYAGNEQEGVLSYRAAYATMRQIVFEILKSFEYFENIKSYSRRADIKLNALCFNDVIYFAPFECEKYPMTAEALVDKRFNHIERREVYFDSLIFHDGNKNGRIIAM